MKTTIDSWPSWVQKALQGVAYWMGHRRCLYPDYLLSEGALVAEICNLVHANLLDKFVLRCEVQYSSLTNKVLQMPEFSRRARADLVVAKTDGRRKNKTAPKFIIEIKRAATPKAQIDSDLRRLAAVRRVLSDVRTFLFVISEANRPTRFVDKEGKSILGRHKIPESDGYYRVRRTWKAAHAYTKRDRAQYACFIEVYHTHELKHNAK